MAYTSIKGYHIPIDTLSEDEYNEIKEELTVTPAENDYIENVNDFTFKVYRVNKKRNQLIVPRFYGQKKFGQVPEKYKYETIDVEFNGQLRDYQEPIVEQCMDHINTFGGGILSVPCGYGKTLMSVYMSIKLGLKTFVLVDKSFLLDQWMECIKEFSNARVGIVRQSTVQIDDYDIVIGMVQSISGKKYNFKSFGTLVVDECHHYGARFFSKALSMLGTKYVIGLSATPKRKDGLTKVINWYLGEIMYSKKLQTNNQVIVKRFHYFTHNKKFVTKYRAVKGETKADSTRMISNLISLKQRNKLIINIINHLRKDPTRNILVLGERVEHLKELKKGVDRKIKRDVENNVILPNECLTYLYIGDTKKPERDEAAELGNILFGTYRIASEGFNVPRLNTLVLATPKPDVVQSVGRIMRRALQNGDTRPLIIDIADELSIFITQSYARQKLYNACKYVIQNHYSYESVIINMSEYEMVKKDRKTQLTPLSYDSELDVPPVEIINCQDQLQDDEEVEETCASIKCYNLEDLDPF